MKKYTVEDIGYFKYADVKTIRVVYANSWEEAREAIDCGESHEVSTEILGLEKELDYKYTVLEEVEV